MSTPQQIAIAGPVAIQFPPQHLQTLLQGLQELPYKVAQPVIANIEAQLIEVAQRQADQQRAQQAQPAN